MQESQYESNPNGSAPGGGAGVVATVIRWGGALLSVGLVLGIVYWAVMLGQRDATSVPVIRAMEGEARITPEDPGGTEADYQGLEVNEVLASDSPSAVDTDATLAPQEQPLAPEDAPMATLQAEATASTEQPAEQPAPLVVDASRLLVEVDENNQPLPEQPALPVAPDGMVMPERRPANFDKTLPEEGDVIENLILQTLPDEQGDTTQVEDLPEPAPLYGNPVVDPGAPLAQLGAYASLEAANTVWNDYQARYGDLLAGKQRVIEPLEAGGRLLYQLRAAGLEDVAAAQVLCLALRARGADCLAVTQE